MANDLVYLVTAASVACVAAVLDGRTRRIPNWLCYSAMLAGLVLHFALQGGTGVVNALAGLALGGGLLFPFFLVHAMGGGDVKLMAAVCAVAGIRYAPTIVISCAIAGGLLALLLILWHRRIAQTLRNLARLFLHHARHGLEPHEEINLSAPGAIRMPYGIAIAAGVCYSLSAFALGR